MLKNLKSGIILVFSGRWLKYHVDIQQQFIHKWAGFSLYITRFCLSVQGKKNSPLRAVMHWIWYKYSYSVLGRNLF